MSSTINYKAKSGDTVANIATAAGVKVADIIALNEDLQTNTKMVANKVYRLPADAAKNSSTASSDLNVEFHARQTEASKED